MAQVVRNPLQYSCLENPTDRGAWLAIAYGVSKSRTQLNDKGYTKSNILGKHKAINIPAVIAQSPGKKSGISFLLQGPTSLFGGWFLRYQ